MHTSCYQLTSMLSNRLGDTGDNGGSGDIGLSITVPKPIAWLSVCSNCAGSVWVSTETSIVLLNLVTKPVRVVWLPVVIFCPGKRIGEIFLFPLPPPPGGKFDKDMLMWHR